MSGPLIIGAGPAGSAAAIALAGGGLKPVLIDRYRVAPDSLCGGFISWRTAETLRRHAGCDLAQLKAHKVTQLVLYSGKRHASSYLPAPGFGLTRRALDGALRERAISSGARFETDRVREVSRETVHCDGGERRAQTLFLANGKHDIRGIVRSRNDDDPALGLRFRIPGNTALTHLVSGKIELHLFRDGYAGVICQEDGAVNICMAVRKSRFKAASGDRYRLIAELARDNPHFADRVEHVASDTRIDTIGAIPYGWIARSTQPGMFRIGDQAAVIPSLAGEGMSIAVASGFEAAKAFLKEGDYAAPTHQSAFARRSRKAIGLATFLWKAAEHKSGSAALVRTTRLFPPLARWTMQQSRLSVTPST